MLGRAAGVHPEKAKDDYRRKYYAALNTVIVCIKERFEQIDCEMYATQEQPNGCIG